jgi:hypothetical protein
MMGDRETSAIIGLKRDLKDARAKARNVADENRRWRAVAQMLKKFGNIDDQKFANVLRSESLSE